MREYEVPVWGKVTEMTAEKKVLEALGNVRSLCVVAEDELDARAQVVRIFNAATAGHARFDWS